MFRGRYFHTVDPKGRLSIPSKFREVLANRYDDTNGLIVANFDHCLVAYPEEEWARLEEKLVQLPSTQLEVRALRRLFFSSGVDCPPDKQGRILVPLESRRSVGITKNVLLAGAVNYFEIWSRERWDEYSASNANFFETMSDKLANLGI